MVADPITREQVERAIAHSQNGDQRGINDALGYPWYEHAPGDVRYGWDFRHASGYAPLTAALTRWRDELAAAEPVRRVARWDGMAYALDPHHVIGEAHIVRETREEAIAWGYEIEGGPEPIRETWPDGCDVCEEAPCECDPKPEPKPAEDSPERLRERREALGWTLWDAARAMDNQCVDAAAVAHWEVPGAYAGTWRQHYAAALSAEERRAPREVATGVGETATTALSRAVAGHRAERPIGERFAEASAQFDAAVDEALLQQASDAMLAAGARPPERPAPRFKVGDWAADDRGEHGQISRAEWSATQVQWRYVMGSVDYPERDLEPTCAPVVTVPQSVVKQHLGIECQWDPGDDHVTLVEPDRGVGLPASLALLRAMLEAIDAQHGGAS